MELHCCLAIWSCELSLMQMTLSLFLWMSCFSTIFYPVVLASINDACLHQLIYWRWLNCDFSNSIISLFFIHFHFVFSLFVHILLKEEIPSSFSEYHYRLLILFLFSASLSFDIAPSIFQHLLAIYHRMSQYHNLLSLPQI